MNDLALAIETIREHASKGAQVVFDADDAVQAALATGDEKAVLAAVDAYIAAYEAWHDFRMKCAGGGFTPEEQDLRLQDRQEWAIEVPAGSTAHGVFAAVAKSVDEPFEAYIEALDKEKVLFDKDDDFDDDFDPDAIEEEIKATEKAYLAALKPHHLSNRQWQAIHFFRARLAK